jgi:hypothetical protein
MALKYSLDSAEDFASLPETLQEHYVEANGKYVLQAEGVKPLADFEKVTTALSAARKDAKTIKEQYTPFESFMANYPGKTLADIQSELERIPVLEESTKGTVSKEKLDGIIEAAAKNRVAPVERDLGAARGRVAELELVVRNYEEANRQRTISDAVREVASKDSSLHESAYAGATGALMLLMGRCLTIDESTNRVVVADGIEGMTPGLGVKDALSELKAQHPYLVKNSFGGGASGGTGAPGGGANPFKSDNMTDRANFIKANPDKWQKAMASAGLKSPMQKYTGK